MLKTNKKEIMSMTDEELRVKAAELMGFVKATNKEVANAFCVDLKDAKLINKHEQRYLWRGKDKNAPTGWQWEHIEIDPDRHTWAIGVIPDYTNDIAAAWELLDKWVFDGGTYEFAWGGCYCEPNEGEVYENYVLLGTIAIVKIGRKTNTAKETAKAITRAFIMAMDGDGNG